MDTTTTSDLLIDLSDIPPSPINKIQLDPFPSPINKIQIDSFPSPVNKIQSDHFQSPSPTLDHKIHSDPTPSAPPVQYKPDRNDITIDPIQQV
jgi:hypothetical protein